MVLGLVLAIPFKNSVKRKVNDYVAADLRQNLHRHIWTAVQLFSNLYVMSNIAVHEFVDYTSCLFRWAAACISKNCFLAASISTCSFCFFGLFWGGISCLET